MRTSVEQLPGEPIIIVNIGKQIANSVSDLYGQVADLVDRWSTPVYAIYNLGDMEVNGAELLSGLSRVTAKTPGSLSDPRIRAMIVGTSDSIQTGVHAMQSGTWGNMNVELCDTLENAVAFARQQIANGR